MTNTKRAPIIVIEARFNALQENLATLNALILGSRYGAQPRYTGSYDYLGHTIS
jgi:hypothetical protein